MTQAEFLYGAVNLATDSTTVYSGPCVLRGFQVKTALSAHDVPVVDNATTIFTIPASSQVGEWFEAGDMRIESSLVVDPDDSATGEIVAVYMPFHDGAADSGGYGN